VSTQRSKKLKCAQKYEREKKKMKKVIIYSTPTCVYCKMAKEFFVKNNVPFEDHDVSANMKAREEMIGKSHQLGVPVIDIEGEIFVGFDRQGISEALGITG
jgi:glutaredoxin-like YruB-family protein